MKVPCPICGPSEARLWRFGWPHKVLRCRTCGLGITWPIPTDRDLARYYGGDYYERDRMGCSASAGWPERAGSILSLLPEPVDRALDVGAGQGHLVAALRARGLEAEGIEPLESGRRDALSFYGVELLAAWPSSSGRRFDVVTMIHSLEHVREPRATLVRAREHVRPGGLLFVDVPHAGTADMWLPARRRSILALPAHLHHFTPTPLLRLLHVSGWQAVSLHLTNPELLERLFRLRWLLGGRGTLGAAEPLRARRVATGQPSKDAPTTTWRRSLRAAWRESTLPWIRRRWPGWRVMVVCQTTARGH